MKNWAENRAGSGLGTGQARPCSCPCPVDAPNPKPYPFSYGECERVLSPFCCDLDKTLEDGNCLLYAIMPRETYGNLRSRRSYVSQIWRMIFDEVTEFLALRREVILCYKLNVMHSVNIQEWEMGRPGYRLRDDADGPPEIEKACDVWMNQILLTYWLGDFEINVLVRHGMCKCVAVWKDNTGSTNVQIRNGHGGINDRVEHLDMYLQQNPDVVSFPCFDGLGRYSRIYFRDRPGDTELLVAVERTLLHRGDLSNED